MERLSRAYGRLLDALAFMGLVIIVAMVGLICANVTLRNLHLGAIVWTDEVSEYGLYALTLLSAPWLLHRASHIRADVLIANVPRVIGWALELIGSAFGLMISLVFVWYGTMAALDSFRAGSLTIKSLVFPEWWLIAPLPATFLLLALEFVFIIHRAWTGPHRPTISNAANLV